MASLEAAETSLAQLAERCGATLHGDGGVTISATASLAEAGPGALSFLANPRYRSQLAQTRASAVCVAPGALALVPSGCQALVGPDPYLLFARAAQWLASRRAPLEPAGIHPQACGEPGAEVAPRARVAAVALGRAGARVGARAVVSSGCSLGRDTEIGADTVLHPRVAVYDGCRLGARCIVHAGVVIGGDGFGFARDGERWVKVPQTGRVVVGDDVEIGANTTIDRGALEDTVIESGCKLDNQIQVAHGVRIGAHTAIAACVGIAGSARIGARCMIGGAAGILGHLHIADDTVISAMSLVSRSIERAGFYSGVFPLMDNRAWERAAVGVKQIDRLRERVRALERAATPPK
ncbi:MAG: UDP-3-O-(3-hydroxymyristoyl)glucosamine N-acyltransferase [Burkholderiales bacterium]|nr:MAG: UDP-3-O-(3-hydroxymyristoyl)glucosamine N-acyltransferase [Burkholderiales bacterium]